MSSGICLPNKETPLTTVIFLGVVLNAYACFPSRVGKIVVVHECGIVEHKLFKS